MNFTITCPLKLTIFSMKLRIQEAFKKKYKLKNILDVIPYKTEEGEEFQVITNLPPRLGGLNVTEKSRKTLARLNKELKENELAKLKHEAERAEERMKLTTQVTRAFFRSKSLGACCQDEACAKEINAGRTEWGAKGSKRKGRR